MGHRFLKKTDTDKPDTAKLLPLNRLRKSRTLYIEKKIQSIESDIKENKQIYFAAAPNLADSPKPSGDPPDEPSGLIPAAPGLAAAPPVSSNGSAPKVDPPNLEEKKETAPSITSQGKSLRDGPKHKVKGEAVSDAPKEPSELAKKIIAVAHASKLEPGQVKRLAEPIVAYKAGETVNYPCLDEMYRTNPTFVQYVDYTLKRLISYVKAPLNPSRETIIKTLRSFNTPTTGWLDFERLHGIKVAQQSSESIPSYMDMFFK